MPLVVIHGHATVVLAATCLGKEGVGRYRTVNVEASASQFLNGWQYLLFLFPAEQPAVAGMRVKSGDTYARIVNAKLLAGVANQFGNLDDAWLLHSVASLAQRDVCRDVDYAQELISQQHGIFLCAREVGIYLGMSVEVMTGKVQRLLVKRSRHGAVHLARHSQFDGFYYRNESSVSALRSHLARLELLHVDAVEVINIDGSIFKLCLADVCNGVYLHVGTQLLGRPFHYFGVASNYWAALLVGFFYCKGLNHYLRSDACWVAHGDC